MAQFLQCNIERPFLLGPDEESQQWVESIAKHDKVDFAVARKQRKGDTEVIIQLPVANFKGRNVVLVDDLASSGQTLIETARQLKQYQPKSISVLVTHALFHCDSIQQLHEAGVSNIWSCNSVTHATNAVSLTELLAESLKPYLSD